MWTERKREVREQEMRNRQRGLRPRPVAVEDPPLATAKPRDLTVEELAEQWNVSPNMIRKWFRKEDGVLRWGRSESRPGQKRAYLSLRIPPEVAERVRRRLSGA